MPHVLVTGGAGFFGGILKRHLLLQHDERLGWRPTLNNEEILLQACRYHEKRRQEINRRRKVSAHSRATPMGVIRLLKRVS